MKSPRLFAPMLAAFILLGTSLWAEEVALRQSAMLKTARSAVSIKAGTVVELIARDGDTLTIKYKDLTGKIPAAKLEEPKSATGKPTEAKPKDDSAPVRPPQTNYGKAVQKAKDSVKEHDKNVVKPTEEILP